MWMSIQCIESGSNQETSGWLSFWTIFGLFQTFEMFFFFITYLIPYYSLVRLAFFLYLMLPQFQGALTLYQAVFQPLLAKHKSEIQAFIQKIQTQADKIGGEAIAAAKNKAAELSTTENILKAAQVA